MNVCHVFHLIKRHMKTPKIEQVRQYVFNLIHRLLLLLLLLTTWFASRIRNYIPNDVISFIAS